MAASGVVIAAYANSDETTAVATTTTAADGSYTLLIPADKPLDGFLKATKSGNVDTYLYPPVPLAADFSGAAINVIDTATFGILQAIAGTTGSTDTTVALEVVDSLSTLVPVAGAAVTSVPAAQKTGFSKVGSAIPDLTAMATINDGRAFLFGVPAGTVTVSATAAVGTFKSTTIKTHVGAFTTTLITE